MQRQIEANAAKVKAQQIAVAPAASGPAKSDSLFQVSKGMFSGSMELSVSADAATDITISDPVFDGNVTISFVLHWHGSLGADGSRYHPWRFSTYDKNGIKLDQFSLGIPDTISLGEKVKGRVTLNARDIPAITRIVIHK